MLRVFIPTPNGDKENLPLCIGRAMMSWGRQPHTHTCMNRNSPWCCELWESAEIVGLPQGGAKTLAQVSFPFVFGKRLHRRPMELFGEWADRTWFSKANVSEDVNFAWNETMQEHCLDSVLEVSHLPSLGRRLCPYLLHSTWYSQPPYELSVIWASRSKVQQLAGRGAFLPVAFVCCKAFLREKLQASNFRLDSFGGCKYQWALLYFELLWGRYKCLVLTKNNWENSFDYTMYFSERGDANTLQDWNLNK